MKRIFTSALCLLSMLLPHTPLRAGTATGEEYVVFMYNGLTIGRNPQGSWPPDGQASITDYTAIATVSADIIREGISVEWGVDAGGTYRIVANPAVTSYPTYFLDMGAAVVSERDWNERSGWNWNHNLSDTGIPASVTHSSASSLWREARATSVSLQMDVEDCHDCKDDCDSTAADLEVKCVSIRIPLGGMGPNTQRTAAGHIFIYEETPTPDLGSPASLKYNFTNQRITTSYSSGAISSVVTPEVTAAVTVLSASSYEIEITPNGSGTTLPDRTVRIERQDPNGEDILVTDTQTYNSITSSTVNRYQWDSGRNGWYLSEGVSGSNYLRKTFRNEVKTSSALVVTEETYSDGDILSDKVVTTYTNINGDNTGRDIWMETSRVQGNGGLTRTTTTTYFDNWPLDGDKYRKRATVTTPEGVVTTYTYDTYGRELTATTTYPDSTPTRVITKTYSLGVTGVKDPYLPLSERIEISGQTSSYKEYERYDYETIERNYASSGSYLETIYQRYGLSAPEANRNHPSATYHPDGTMTLYTYNFGTPHIYTTDTGKPDGSGTSIVSGTRTIVKRDRNSNLILEESLIDIATALTLEKKVYTYDDRQRVTNILYLDGSNETNEYKDCCRTVIHTDRNGAITEEKKDPLGRPYYRLRNGIKTIYEHDGSGRLIRETREGRDTSTQILREVDYDILGRTIETRTPSPATPSTLESTTTVYTGWFQRTGTNALGGTAISITRADNRQISVTGTATQPSVYEYGINGTGEFTKEYLGTSTSAPEWTLTQYDWLGRTLSITHPDSAQATNRYNALGQLEKTIDPDGVITLFSYDDEGRQVEIAIDINQNSQIDPGTDRIRYQTQTVVDLSSMPWITTEQGWRTSGGDVVEQVLEQSPNGLITKQTAFGAQTITTTTRLGDGELQTETVHSDGTKTVTQSTYGLTTSATRLDTTSSPLSEMVTTYDDHNRLAMQTTSDDRTITYTYNDADLPTSEVRSGTGVTSLTTSFAYDKLGRRITTTLPDTSTQHTEYWPTGEVKKSYGSQQYPVEYTYDAQGRMKTMVTTGAAGNATTTWNYDSERGWLVSKLDHANKGPIYTYTPAGRLETRTWARGVETEYTYNTAGDLSAIDYSDSTPNVGGITYDLQGRRTSVTDGGGTRTFTYAGGNQLATEANTTLGWAVTRTYDAKNRRASLAATLQPDTLTYDYSSTTGRLETLTQGDYEWTYDWNEPLGTIATTIAKKNSNLILTATKTFDGHGRLTSIVNTDKNAVVFTSHAYTYDSLGRRTQAQREDTTYWDYTYDQYGQVTGGVKKRADGSPIPGYQFGYTFDSIGNRTETNTNGRTESYTPNLLNQYITKENQGIINVTGTATTASIVTVNEQPTVRLGEYFAGTASGDNSTSAINITADIHAVNPGAGPSGEDVVSTAAKSEVVSPEEEAFTYDDDGNLTADGKWNYTWDAENRLIVITPKVGNEVLLGKNLAFGYDTDAKRIWQDTADWNEGTSSWNTPIRKRYLYDGWNLLVITDDTVTTASKRFAWGYDLSNTREGVGGVGGLLLSHAVTEDAIPMYDGNGNVIALGDSNSDLMGIYEYGPFGQLLKVSDPQLIEHPFQWNTKFYVAKVDLSYYGYRYYDAVMGRWPSRDPIGERGGINLYAFVANNGANWLDVLGLDRYVKGAPVEPPMSFDQTFAYDPNATATVGDYASWAWWKAKLAGGQLFRGDLVDATRAYAHYLHGGGADLEINYTKAYGEDEAIRNRVNQDITDAQLDAERLWDGKEKSFSITGQAVRVGNPSTENWQKTVGQHWVWGAATVKTCVDGNPDKFEMLITMHEKDRYNFNPGASDIATGAPDNANGRFSTLGWAHAFITNGTVVRKVTWEKGSVSSTTSNTDPPRR